MCMYVSVYACMCVCVCVHEFVWMYVTNVCTNISIISISSSLAYRMKNGMYAYDCVRACVCVFAWQMIAHICLIASAAKGLRKCIKTRFHHKMKNFWWHFWLWYEKWNTCTVYKFMFYLNNKRIKHYFAFFSLFVYSLKVSVIISILSSGIDKGSATQQPYRTDFIFKFSS